MILHISSGDGTLPSSWAKDGVAVINAIAVIVPASALSPAYRVDFCSLISVPTPSQMKIHSRILNENHLHLQQKFSKKLDWSWSTTLAAMAMIFFQCYFWRGLV
jgi:hypothetical protein